MSRVVDTDVVSFIFKNDTRSALYLPHIANRVVVISFMTLAEVEQWMLSANWGARRRRQLETHMHRYAVRQSSSSLCRHWAEVADSARRNGRPIDTADAWVAATALQLGVPLVTHNRAHFVGVDNLTIISES